MRTISLFGFLLCLCSITANAFTNDIELVKITRNQMVLSQKITKLYFMLGANLKAEQTQHALNAAIKEFDNGNLSLKTLAKESSVQDDLRPMTLSWQVYKAQLGRPFVLAKANDLLQMNEQLSTAERNFLQDLQKAFAITIPDAVVASDQQRMLSQKIATFYVALYAGAPVPELEADLQKAVERYDAGLNNLMSKPENTPEIRKYLAKTKGQWDFSKSGLAYQKNGQFTPYVILATTDAMQKSMDTVAAEYQHAFLPQNRLASAKLDF
ncbi:MAG TPA: hypothetical protein VFM46_01890 [Pseudomonadales bacterium]|nr:hypothetical protein [Pseudomonadales bacterium]